MVTYEQIEAIYNENDFQYLPDARHFMSLIKELNENNKVKYAEKHGYAYLAKTDEFYGFEPGFEKIQFMIDIFDTYPDTEWIWWTGTDSMVTNFNIKVEDFDVADAFGIAHYSNEVLTKR